MPTAINIAYRLHDELKLVVLFHGKHNPSDTEWTPYVNLLRTVFERHGTARVLVVSGGGHPSRSQRSEMTATLRQLSARISVISPSVVARFVTSVLVLSNPGICCFSPEQRREAYTHLGLPPSKTAEIDKFAMQVGQVLAVDYP